MSSVEVHYKTVSYIMQTVKMRTLLYLVILSAVQAKYNRTVIEERDMYRDEAEEWRHTTHAFIRACGRSGSFGAVAQQCTAGIVLKEKIKPGCVCVRGVWIVHFDLCTAAPVIIMGGQRSSYDCYYIDKEVHTFLFVGDPTDPFKLKAYVTPQTMHVFAEVPMNGSWSPLMDFRDPVLIIIRGGSDKGVEIPYFEDEEDRFCFKYRKEANKPYEGEDGVIIWTTALLPTRYRMVPHGSDCTDPDNIGYDALSTHKAFYYYGFRGTPPISLGCFEPCSIWPRGKPLLRNSEEERKYPREEKTFMEWLQVFRSESARREELKSRLHRKPRAVTNCEMVWDGRAYCMKSYWDAVDKFEFTDKVKQRCFPEVGKNLRGAKKLKRYGRRRREVGLHVYSHPSPQSPAA